MDARDRILASDQSTVYPGRTLGCLVEEGFIDSFRHFHDYGGLTFSIGREGARSLVSRLDQIWIRGVTLENSSVSDPPTSSDHLLLKTSALFTLDQALPPPSPPVFRAIPLVYRSSTAQRIAFTTCIAKFIDELNIRPTDIPLLPQDEFDNLVSRLLDRTHNVACSIFGSSRKAQAKRDSLKRATELKKEIDCLTGLRSQLYLHTIRSPSLIPLSSRFAYDTDLERINNEIDSLRSKLSRLPQPESVIYTETYAPSSQLLDSYRKRQRQPVDSITDPSTGRLATDKASVQRILRDHFMKDLNPPVTPVMPLIKPPWFDAVFSPLPSINNSWFSSLLAPITHSEAVSYLKSKGWKKSPGPDLVAAPILRVLMETESPSHGHQTADMLLSIINAMLSTHDIPHATNGSIILPIPKNSSRLASSLRPIALQSALLKTLNGVLASRLTVILNAHPILHRAQEAFLQHGSSSNLVASLVDILEHRRRSKKACYVVLYDIARCYDSIPHWLIELSLRRICLPQPFISFIMASLRGAWSQVWTKWGPSSPFPLSNGLRQGDPLSPLISIIVLDSLLRGLVDNPLAPGRQFGYKIHHARFSTGGFADDFRVTEDSWDATLLQNEWVGAFCNFAGLEINAEKSFFSGMDARGAAHPTFLPLVIQGHSIVPSLPSAHTKYMGIHISLDLDWKRAKTAVSSSIGYAIHFARANRLSLPQTLTILRRHLTPALDYRFRAIPMSLEELTACDNLVAKHLSKIVAAKWSIKADAISALLDIPLPSSIWCQCNVTELTLRLSDPSNLSARFNFRHEKFQRVLESGYANKIHTLSRFGILLRIQKEDRPPLQHTSAFTRWLETEEGLVPLAHEQNAFVSDEKALGHSVIAFTDGSRDPVTQDASSAVVLPSVRWSPSEMVLNTPDVALKLMSSRNESHSLAFPFSFSSYDAEVRAIALAVSLVPLQLSLSIFSDSKSAIQNIQRFDQLSARQQLRAPQRPFLRAISNLSKRKQESFGATVTLHHVKAHTENSDPLSIGNAYADLVAGSSLRKAPFWSERWRDWDLDFTVDLNPNHPASAGPSGLMWVSNDPRKSIRTHCMTVATRQWEASPSQGGWGVYQQDIVTFMRTLSSKRPDLLCFALKVFTSTLGEYASGHGKGLVASPYCPMCLPLGVNCRESVAHIFSCPVTTKIIKPEFPPSVFKWVTDSTHLLVQRLGLHLPPCQTLTLEGITSVSRKKSFMYQCFTFAARCYAARSSIFPIASIFRPMNSPWL